MNNLRSHIMRLHKIERAQADKHIENLAKINKQDKSNEAALDNGLNEKDGKESDSEKDNALSEDTDLESKEDSEMLNEATTISEKDTYYVKTNSVSKKITYHCKICSKVMNHRSNMVDHVRSHSGMKMYKCKICGKGLSRKQNLVHHLKYVHFIDGNSINYYVVKTDQETENDIVDAEQTKNEILTSALESGDAHSNVSDMKTEDSTGENETGGESSRESVLECDNSVNGRTSDTNGDSKVAPEKSSEPEITQDEKDDPELGYEVVNSDNIEERFFRCKECGFTCNRRHDMAAKHLMKHTGQKPYICVVCSKPYTRKYVLRNHIGKEHKLSGAELENLVEASDFSDKKSKVLINSLNVKDNEIIENEEDGKVKRKLNYATHEDSYSSVTNEFEHIDPSDFSFEQVQSKNGKGFVYKCNHCGFTCTRRYYMVSEHKLKHAGIKPYLCVICCKMYSRKYVLRQHLLTEHKIKGKELNDIMECTGNRLDESVKEDSFNESYAEFDKPENVDLLRDLELCLQPEKRRKLESSDKVDSQESVFEQSGNHTDNHIHGFDKNVTGQDEQMVDSVDHLGDLSENDAYKESDTLEFDTVGCEEQGGHVTFEHIGEAVPNNSSGETFLHTSTGLNHFDHINNHTASGSYENIVDNVQKNNKKSIQKHDPLVRNLMDGETCTCLECGKKCSNLSNLRQHIKIKHLNLKRFACPECNKAFNTNSNLKVHMRQHLDTSVKDMLKLECEVCKNLFTTKSNLKSHRLKVHPGHADMPRNSCGTKGDTLNQSYDLADLSGVME